MKRRIVSFMLAGLLLLSGCSQSGSSGGAEDGEAGALNKNSSEEEIIAYVEERLPQVAELHELIHGGFVEVDEEDKRGLYSKFHDAEVSYNRVIDERFDSLEEIDRAVSRFFSSDVYTQDYRRRIYDEYSSLFVETEGALYVQDYSDPYVIVNEWHFDKGIEVFFRSENRIAFYAQVTDVFNDTIETGKIVLEREDGEWKFACRVVDEIGVPFTKEGIGYGPVFPNIREATDYLYLMASKVEEGGPEMPLFDTDAENLIEFDEDFTHFIGFEDGRLMVGVSVYYLEEGKDPMLYSRLWMPVNDSPEESGIFHEWENDAGDIISWDYRLVEEESGMELFAYAAVKNTSSDVDAWTLMYDFAAEYLWTDRYIPLYPSDEHVFFIVPKFSGMKVRVFDKDGTMVLSTTGRPVAIGDLDKVDRVVLSYDGEEVEIRPSYDLNMTLDKGVDMIGGVG